MSTGSKPQHDAFTTSGRLQPQIGGASQLWEGGVRGCGFIWGPGVGVEDVGGVQPAHLRGQRGRPALLRGVAHGHGPPGAPARMREFFVTA